MWNYMCGNYSVVELIILCRQKPFHGYMDHRVLVLTQNFDVTTQYN